MTYEEMKTIIEKQIDKIRESRKRCGWSDKEIERYVSGTVLGMVKGFKFAGLLDENQEIDLFLELY